ncbi:MAG: CHAD domain-containing protein [Gammaproteobacteria bacterium]|jgi:CHAD domain-containing protein
MPLEFTIPSHLGADEILSEIRNRISYCDDSARTVRRTYYDSFDWRLYSNDAVLEEDSDDKGPHALIWRPLNGNKPPARIALSRPVHFAADLPSGEFRNRLERILEMRELIPLARILSRTRTLRILNRDEKTVARLVVEENSLPQQKGTRSRELDRRARVIPVKGYPKPCKKVVGILEDLGLSAAADDLLQTAMAVLGKTPGDYTSKLDLQLDPGMRADQAIRIILHRLLDIMIANEAGVRAGRDTEFLHDFRVAVRRTRSALTQIKGVLPARVLARYKADFAWLGQATSPLRDVDVYLLKFDDYRDSLPASMRGHIEPLREFLLRHQQIEHRKLVKVLNSARYRRLLDGWRNFLEQPVSERSTLKNARRPVLEVSCQRIWRVYQRILREGNAISADSPATALHELRKTGKKLRYLMEFFQSLFPEGKIRELIRELKTLQDNLGDFQDYEVQVAALKQFGQQMVDEDSVPAETLLAMGMLIDGLERRQHGAREEFAGRFANFALPKNQDKFRKLFTGCGTALRESGL